MHIAYVSTSRRRVAPIFLAGLLAGLPPLAARAQTTCATDLNYNACGYPTGSVTITTTSGSNAPQYSGIYMKWNAFHLDDLTITTSGAQSDGVRGDDTASWLFANNLTVTTTGSSADGINIASNSQGGAMPSGVVISGSASISTSNASAGMGVRVNNFLRADDLSIAILPGGSTIKVTGTGTATQGSSAFSSDAYGYGVYAGNRMYDTNNIGGTGTLAGGNNNTLGNSYAFIGGGSTISDSMKNGHAVYANKGGLVQLGDGVNVSATGAGGYALYAATEQQGSYDGIRAAPSYGVSNGNVRNVRPGYIYLEGGATLRAGSGSATATVMQASGADSIIANRALDISGITYPVSSAFTSMAGLPDKTADWTETSGVFDVIGILSAINGGAIDLDMADGSGFLGATAMTGAASALNLHIDGAHSQWTINANSALSALNLSASAVLTPNRATPAALTSYTLQGAVGSNGGVIDLSNDAPGDTFTIAGSYAGSGNAQARLDTALGDETSLTDKLVVDGATLNGATALRINNVGGTGAQTADDGILVVEVTGASSGTFVLDPATTPLRAGDYEYKLVRGTANPDNWYLQSSPFSDPQPPGGSTHPSIGGAAPAPIPALGSGGLALLALLLAGAAAMNARRFSARRCV